ncbi:MAG TPA: ABC transporter permease [Virgibacillus sp.]|nr:ABC transporter permease [Virgibacillus sp.]
MSQVVRVMRRNSMKFLVLPSLLLLLIFFVYPIITILVKSVTDPEFGFQNYIKFFSQSAYIGALLNTFKIAFLVTAITVILAYPVAYVMTIAPPKIKGLMMLLVLLPFWTALLVRTFSWMVLLQDNGIVNKLLMWLGIVDDPLTLINSLTGVVIGMVYIMLPFMILPMHTTMNSIDRNLLQAAGNLGAAPWKAFLRVFLPLSLPGVGTGAIIVFVMTLGYYIIPALLGGTNEIMLGEFIADQIQSHLNWGIGTTAGAVLVVITLVFFVIYLKVNEPETKEE